MHKALYQAESQYKEIYPDKEFKRVNLSNIINHIISYSQNWSKTISTSFLVTNSVYDGSHAIHFDCEEVVANRKFVPDETWERFHVLEGVEINVRADIMNKYESLVMAWIKYLKSLVKQ